MTKRNNSSIRIIIAGLFFLYNYNVVYAQEICLQDKIINSGNVIDANWPMDGTGNDTIGVANNPVSIAPGVSFNDTSFLGGYAASFDGTGGILYSDGSFMETAITNISFGAWIKPASVSPAGNQIIFDEGSSNGFSIYHNSNNEIVFVVADGSQANSDDLRFTFPTDGQYHHIAFTYANGRFKIFLDGLIIVQKATGFGGISAHSDDGGLGATFGTTSSAKVRFPGSTFTPYIGLIDEVFYTRNVVQDGNIVQYARCHGKSIPTGMGCSADAYMVQDANSGWISINLATGKVNPATGTIDDGYAPAGTSLNGIGYNSLDETLYGIDAQTGYLMQVQVTSTPLGYSYKAFRVAYIPELNGLNVITGEVYNGYLYLRENAGNEHFKIDVNQNSPTYLRLIATVTESTSSTFYDWAYNPQDGLFYTVSYSNGQLLSIDPNTGTVVSLGSVGLGVNDTYGAVYFDNQGFLYIYNNTSGDIHRVDVDGVSKTGVLFSKARTGLNLNDGSRCADAPLPLDFGDAQDMSTSTVGIGIASGQFKTMLSNNGPRHVVNSFIPLMMGNGVTLENDGKPGAGANIDTDDGISSFPTLIGGTPQNIPGYSVQVTVTNSYPSTSAVLYGWIDWNCDGDFTISERDSIVIPANTSGGIVTLNWSNKFLTGPNGTAGTYARFRLSTDTAAKVSFGVASDGEVEDYYIPFTFALPIPSLSFFTVNPQSNIAGKKVIVNWAVEDNERYLKSFELERTNDLNNGFSLLAKINANGSVKNYDIIDQTPCDSINYYRLKIIDLDNNYNYSDVKIANFKGLGVNPSELNIFPNPFSSELYVYLKSTEASGYTISIYDAIGKKMSESIIDLSENEDKKLKYSMLNYANGIYFVHITKDGSAPLISKVVKQ